MKPLKSLNEYLDMIKRLRKQKIWFVNDVLLPNEAKRYIALNRMRYTKDQAGVIFFADEETYYRAILCIDADKPWAIEALDKPVLIRNGYQSGRKKASIVKLEQQMKENGFQFQNTGMLMNLDVAKYKEKSRKEFNRAKKILDHFHYKIGPASIEQYDQMQEMFRNQDMIQYYHEAYRTDEEIKERFDRNEYTCISDVNGQVLVYSSWYILNGYRYGDRTIAREEYRMSGLTPILMHYAISRAQHDVMTGSVLTHNEPTIKVHKRLGWQITDHCFDYWLLQ